MKGPDVFEYDDYRAFLKDYISSKQETGPPLSVRWLSRRAGFDGHTFMAYVLKGERNLGPRSIRKVARALDLEKDEEEYFENMVLMNQATTDEDKDHFHQKMSSAGKCLDVHQTDRDMSSITIPMTKDRFVHAREKIETFSRELYALLAEPSEEGEQTVYQINFQLFSLSEGGDA